MKYTILGIYVENHQRYATVVEAATPEEAEREAQRECLESIGWHPDLSPPLWIAGIIEGDVNVVA